MKNLIFQFFLTYYLCVTNTFSKRQEINTKLCKVWGPGLNPDKVILPARYFFIQAVDNNNQNISKSLEEPFHVVIDGATTLKKPCRVWSNILDRKDGSYIVRYKVYEPCSYLKITIKYQNSEIAESPYVTNNVIYPDTCNCPVNNINTLLELWDCGTVPRQIIDDLSNFESVDWEKMRQEVITNFDKPYSISICHYVIKNNNIHRKCYGKYVGFNMFMDNILLFLTRRVQLPDMEFFVNLGDWPLSSHNLKSKYPILSWCASTESYDIVMPTYDLTESTLENMGRVMLDMLSVQGNVEGVWETRRPQLFWRGRDSNKHRLDLIKMSKEHPDLFNVSLTNFFFYRDEEHIYGPKTEHVSFFKFFDYKYQLAIDGTVAAYRMPYLMGGGSLVFKQASSYHEHFYNNLQPNIHYIPIKKDLSDLVEKLNWAIENDEKAKVIAKNGQNFANENLLPKDIICYHVHLLNELNKRTVSKVDILDGMEHVQQKKAQECSCNKIKDEL